MDDEELILRLKKALEMEKWASGLYAKATLAACDKESEMFFSRMHNACKEHAKLLGGKIRGLRVKHKSCGSVESALSFAEAGTREEQGMRDYYRELSETISDPGLKDFFGGLSLQEEAHEKETVALVEALKKKA